MNNEINTDTYTPLEELSGKAMRVAAFCRSAITEGPPSIIQLLYEAMVSRYPNWTFAGCYGGKADMEKSECCQGGLPQLMADCKAGKIGLVLTKSPQSISRNLVDCIAIINELKALSPPVGIYFEHYNMLTLHSEIEFTLAAIHESDNKTALRSGLNMMPHYRFNLLKAVRTSKGMTQQEVANLAGVHLRQYRRYECGERSLYKAAFWTGIAICNALDIRPERLLWAASPELSACSHVFER